MEAEYPTRGSALARGRRRRCSAPRQRHRTAPVTFAEIEEVDEEQEVCEEREALVPAERRRRPDELVELSREFAEFRRRRATRHALREPDEPPPTPAHGDRSASSDAHPQLARASSEPT